MYVGRGINLSLPPKLAVVPERLVCDDWGLRSHDRRIGLHMSTSRLPVIYCGG